MPHSFCIEALCIYFYLFGGLRQFKHCTGHITTGSWKGIGNQYDSLSGFCTVNCRPTASNYQLSCLRPCWEPKPRPQRWEEALAMIVVCLFTWVLGHRRRNVHDYGFTSFYLKR